MRPTLSRYHYVYIIPTSSSTSGSFAAIPMYGGSFVGGSSNSVNPADIISGYIMQKGYVLLPELKDELSEKTMVISYGETGEKNSGFVTITEVIIQFRDSQTGNLICSGKAGCTGGEKTKRIRNAIERALDAIFEIAEEPKQT
ncbi:MAG TPA: hypothetical protein DIW30_04665 [Bacteroidales bacterium]|nr:hypothetical protein [Bacteroidales bacterium]